LPNYINKKE
jgi:hypothetical protein